MSDFTLTSVHLHDDCEVDVRCVRNPRARRMKLSINEHGVRLTLPPRGDLVAAEHFLWQHRDWLSEQWRRCHGERAIAPLQPFRTVELPLRGLSIPLSWHEGRYGKVELTDGRARFQLPPDAGDTALRCALREFYESQARADIGRWLPKYLPGLPSPPARVRLKMMSSQWGSLTSNRVLALDLALIVGRSSAFEYVLVHELCHLIHHDHSVAFWREVTRRFPSWRDERDYFHLEGRRLKTLLHTLLHRKSGRDCDAAARPARQDDHATAHPLR